MLEVEQYDARQGRKTRIGKMPMSHVWRAPKVDEARDIMKVIVDADTSQIVGAAILGIEGGEVMAVLQIAMMAGLPYAVLRTRCSLIPRSLSR